MMAVVRFLLGCVRLEDTSIPTLGKGQNYSFVELDETIIARTDTEQQAINRIEISNIGIKYRPY